MRQRLVEASWRRNRARAETHAISARSSSLTFRVPTVGIATALIVAGSSQQEQVSDLIEIINDNKSTIARRTGMELDLFGEKVSPAGRLAGFVHPGARTHLVDNKSVGVWPAIAVSLALLLLLILRPPEMRCDPIHPQFPMRCYSASFSAVFVSDLPSK